MKVSETNNTCKYFKVLGKVRKSNKSKYIYEEWSRARNNNGIVDIEWRGRATGHEKEAWRKCRLVNTIPNLKRVRVRYLIESLPWPPWNELNWHDKEQRISQNTGRMHAENVWILVWGKRAENMEGKKGLWRGKREREMIFTSATKCFWYVWFERGLR